MRINLAWLLATHSNDEIRDGSEALRLAKELIERENKKKPMLWDLLGAAQAENGRFQEAIDSARRAVALARANNHQTLARKIEARVTDYYQNNRAYHQRQK